MSTITKPINSQLVSCNQEHASTDMFSVEPWVVDKVESTMLLQLDQTKGLCACALDSFGTFEWLVSN